MALTSVSITGLPDLTWHGEPAAQDFDVEAQRLSITARAGTDWSLDRGAGGPAKRRLTSCVGLRTRGICSLHAN